MQGRRRVGKGAGLVVWRLLRKVVWMTDPNVLFTTLVKPALPLFLLVAVLYVVRFVYRRYKSSIKGSLGEALVTHGTFRLLDEALYRGFSDLYVPRPDGDGLTQVDHVVVSPYGIFVIETKNYTGWIYGSEHQAKWTQTFGSGGEVLVSKSDLAEQAAPAGAVAVFEAAGIEVPIGDLFHGRGDV